MKISEIARQFASGALFFALVSCGGDDPTKPIDPPAPEDDVKVEIPAVSAITSTEVSLSSSYTTNSITIKDKGFCYSTSSGPTLSDKWQACEGDGFKARITGLKAATSYFVRAYVTSSENKTYYSGEKSFTTEKASGLDDYTAPAYPDDYRSIGDWSKRGQWNLANVHDPTVCLAEDGYYYMYQTDASFGNAHAGHGHFHGRRSKDLINWEYLGGTMPSLPSWVKPKLNEIRKAMGLTDSEAKEADFGYWAPCVRKVRNGLYRMYYSIVVPGYINGNNSWSERAFIGLMETSNPADNSSWVDKGYVITNASDKGLNFNVSPTSWEQCYFRWNAIDPSYIITPEGEHWLIYGSWHSGLVAVQLDAETGKVKAELKNPWGNNASDIAAYGKRIYTRLNTSRWQASEGPEIIYKDGWYYLFLAYDGLDIPYNTRVVRSRKVDGPYEDMYGTEVSNAGGDAYPILTHPYKFMNSKGWVGISHCAVFDDGKGNWYYSSQARFPNDAGGAAPNAVMLGHVRRIVWTTDGWPLVLPERYGAVPQVDISESDIVGTWEHIDLAYRYAEQKESVEMGFAADNTISSGPWKGGRWTYNEASKLLTANGVTLYLYRETDWEASPRTHTIVYVGLGDHKTYWGKKKNY